MYEDEIFKKMSVSLSESLKSFYHYSQIECDGCRNETFPVESTFDGWALYQIDMPMGDLINVTYDVSGAQTEDDTLINPFITIDDLAVKPGQCPQYSE